MNKHTPGPWHAENSSVIDSQDQIVVTCFRGSVNRYDHAEDYATARLIAAAPAMYALLAMMSKNGDNAARQIIESIENEEV